MMWCGIHCTSIALQESDLERGIGREGSSFTVKMAIQDVGFSCFNFSSSSSLSSNALSIFLKCGVRQKFEHTRVEQS